ncbi:conserved hypothetical protein [Leishmania major strain Friedlin]|uniref:Uncharacterized protein n=1 Tax=Leishmania major TaxID=5664 RepID=Q4QHM0_LEIMA|nr:conserved hypothetical protein [Leishmania major strain Friedlin]CAG9569773.1 hypothetical_protein_-__conserved [Leishmania major strain Friedlin]CAJ03131.1 conserved hypothetical protein [Leishmania major strain Friedlin]|eukprot:XP_001681328.1 conserved hypothetical protein [Leishmania major strain Friedlin]
MGSSSSKAKATPAVSVPRYEDSPPESTNIGDLVVSGRYKVASPETVELMKQIQAPRDANKMYPDSDVKDLKQYIIEQEGLEIGQARRRALAQQWRFFLSCEPMQRALDAGIILGSVSAFVAFRKPRNRVPAKISLIFLGGFCVGMVSVPLMVVATESYNSKRIKKLEQELFEKQRSEFYKR